MDSQDGRRRSLLDFTPKPVCLQNFYDAPQSSGPWFHPGAIREPSQGDQAAALLFPDGRRTSLPEFQDYRNPDFASDCTTNPDDSGYGSITYSTTSAPAATEEGWILGLMGQNYPIFSANLAVTPQPSPEPPSTLRCDECKATVKSQGELKKHKQRHDKSFKCAHAGCSKGQRGFSTPNDLVRHQRSVHGLHNLPGRSFICPLCPPTAKGHKIWPRADNFRQHLLRAHQIKLNADDDHTRYLHRPAIRKKDLKELGEFDGLVGAHAQPPSCEEPKSITEGIDSALQFNSEVAETREPGHQESVPPAMSEEPMSRDLSPFGLDNSSAEPTVTIDAASSLNTVNNDAPVQPGLLDQRVDLDNGFAGNGEEGVRAKEDFTTDLYLFAGLSMIIDGAPATENQCASASTSKLSPLMEDQQDLKIDWEGWELDYQTPHPGVQEPFVGFGGDAAEAYQLQNAGAQHDATNSMFMETPQPGSDPSEILKFLKQLPKDMLQSALREDEGQDTEHESLWEEIGQKALFECPETGCDKSFNRPCELKKHMKRHQKPYGCTFKSCCKRFGSKNDWKRHESNQHYMLEKWNCDEPGCSKVCQRRESFKNHLQKDHGLHDANALEDKLETCRLGRHCDPRFWCGFCVRVIDIDVNERGGNSWTKRCDHIDSHLFGKDGLERKGIREWRHQEDEMNDPTPRVEDLELETTLLSPTPPSLVDEMTTYKRKRRASNGSRAMPRKKAIKAQFYMWKCCQCDTLVNWKTSSLCFECDHARCLTGCTAEPVISQDSENEDPEGG
ncbi:hypothetical protein HIM_01046 [Hirsutella minnesotensis 3608]|nr:hypothetical protein HIM_01046 [Hirsutella minnesotensis 3608]